MTIILRDFAGQIFFQRGQNVEDFFFLSKVSFFSPSRFTIFHGKIMALHLISIILRVFAGQEFFKKMFVCKKMTHYFFPEKISWSFLNTLFLRPTLLFHGIIISLHQISIILRAFASYSKQILYLLVNFE